MKKFIVLFALVLSVLTLAACTNEENELEAVGLNGLTGKEILNGVADGSIDIEGFGLSVYDDELIVIIDGDRIPVAMPKDEFYLSVAPYINMTHECLYHSATGCRGELKSETVFVEFVKDDGTVLISKEMSTMSNGFIDFWLPRDIEGTMTITQGELSVSKVISTVKGEATCETTMRLS
ncbi:hypothetical protein CI105_07010 [Candidatus Izimaplasma bacterium ZiA1]|uniref:CueP family metal-binding protein n=1 Tax=Candidatus Izimoplasma sp. ZiA1 TaxID=2024899 RepID=UPI000BAA65E9|nr:hypothetical protein CI105_07010 [Candidatus Izimaplasma bacterium ZiA1]